MIPLKSFYTIALPASRGALSMDAPFLDVHAADVRVLDVGLLVGAQHKDGGVGFQR